MVLVKGKKPLQSVELSSDSGSDSGLESDEYEVERLVDYRVRLVPNRKNDPERDDAYNPKLGAVKNQLLFHIKWKGYPLKDTDWEPLHHLTNWTPSYDRDVREIRHKKGRPSIKQYEEDVENKNAILAADEAKRRKEEVDNKAKKSTAKSPDKPRAKSHKEKPIYTDDDNVDPKLAPVRTDSDDDESADEPSTDPIAGTQSGSPKNRKLASQQSQQLAALFSDDEQPSTPTNRLRAPGPQRKARSNVPGPARPTNSPKKQPLIETIEQIDLVDTDADDGLVSEAPTVPTSPEDEAAPAPTLKKRIVARRSGGAPSRTATATATASTSAAKSSPGLKRPASRELASPLKTSGHSDPSKKTKPNPISSPIESDGSNASAKLVPVRSSSGALFAPEDNSTDDDTKPSLGGQSKWQGETSRLPPRPPPPAPATKQPANRPTAPKPSRAVPAARPIVHSAVPAPVEARSVERNGTQSGPAKLNAGELASKLRQSQLYQRLPKGAQSLEDKVREWWSIDHQLVPILDPATAYTRGRQTLYIHAPQANVRLAQSAYNAHAGGQIRAKETQADIFALKLLLCQVSNKMNLVETIDGEPDVVMVHASCSEADLAELKAVRQMGVNEVKFYQFGENFTTKRRDNCRPIWTISAAVTFTPDGFIRNAQGVIDLADRAGDRRHSHEVVIWAPATYSVRGGPLGAPANDQHVPKYQRESAIAKPEGAIRNKRIALTRFRPATAGQRTASFPSPLDRLQPGSLDMNSLAGGGLTAAQAAPVAGDVVDTVKAYAAAYDQMRWIVIGTENEVRDANGHLTNRPEIIFLGFEQAYRMCQPMLR